MGRNKTFSPASLSVPAPRRRDVLALAGAGMAVGATGAWGQNAPWPTRTITLVCALPPGNATDFLARTVAEKLQSKLGVSVIVDNRAGGVTTIAANYVRNAPPDGYTLYLWSSPLSIMSVLMPKLFNYDQLTAYTYLGGVGSITSLLAVHPSVPANTIPELVEWIRSKPPGTVTWGITGVGFTDHLMALQFLQRTGLKVNIVPFKGGAPALQDLLAGRLDVNVQNWASAGQHIQSGKLKMLATLGNARAPYAPNTPSLSEIYPGLSVPADFGIVGPRGIPKAIVDRLEREILEAMRSPDVVAKLHTVGMDAAPATGDQFAGKAKVDFDRMVAVVRSENLKLED